MGPPSSGYRVMNLSKMARIKSPTLAAADVVVEVAGDGATDGTAADDDGDAPAEACTQTSVDTINP